MLSNVHGIQILEHTPARIERKAPAWSHWFCLGMIVVELVTMIACSAWVNSFGVYGILGCFILTGATLLAFEATAPESFAEEYIIAVTKDCTVRDWNDLEKSFMPKFIEDCEDKSIFRMIRKGRWDT